MTSFGFRLLVSLMVGVILSSTIIESASACFLRRRRCRACCSTSVACQPSTTAPGQSGQQSGPGDDKTVPPNPNDLPKITEVPPETPTLVVPDAVKALGNEAATQSESAVMLATLLDERIWTSRDGRVCVARLVRATSSSVTLERDGRRYTVPIDRLTEDDATLIKSSPIHAFVDAN